MDWGFHIATMKIAALFSLAGAILAATTIRKRDLR